MEWIIGDQEDRSDEALSNVVVQYLMRKHEEEKAAAIYSLKYKEERRREQEQEWKDDPDRGIGGSFYFPEESAACDREE